MHAGNGRVDHLDSRVMGACQFVAPDARPLVEAVENHPLTNVTQLVWRVAGAAGARVVRSG